MTGSFRISLLVAVLALCGCQRKAPPPPAPAAPKSAPASTAAVQTAPESSAETPSDNSLQPATTPTPVPGELPIIAKARAFLGTEAALDRIHSIHYVGTLVTTDPSDPKKLTRAEIEIIFQSPGQQLVTTRSDKTIETSALDDYDAWTRITEVKDSTKWQQTLLGVDGVKRLRANMWENLGFFRGLEKEGGRVEDQGEETIDGILCDKVAFIHDVNIVFYRYFDAKTGRLVFTKTDNGSGLTEKGTITVDGVRFPRSIVQVVPEAKGTQRTVKIRFDKITLNETFPEKRFAVPSLER